MSVPSWKRRVRSVHEEILREDGVVHVTGFRFKFPEPDSQACYTSSAQPPPPISPMPRFAANLTMMFNEVPFLERFGAAATRGIPRGGVSVSLRLPGRRDQGTSSIEHQLTLALFNMPAGNWGAGDRGSRAIRRRVQQVRDGVGKAIEYAGRTRLPADSPHGRPQATRRERRRHARHVRRQRAVRGRRARTPRHDAAPRGHQHARHPGLLPEHVASGVRSDGRGRRLERALPVRHLPHADHGR